jgi:hypothetical protein
MCRYALYAYSPLGHGNSVFQSTDEYLAGLVRSILLLIRVQASLDRQEEAKKHGRKKEDTRIGGAAAVGPAGHITDMAQDAQVHLYVRSTCFFEYCYLTCCTALYCRAVQPMDEVESNLPARVAGQGEAGPVDKQPGLHVLLGRQSNVVLCSPTAHLPRRGSEVIEGARAPCYAVGMNQYDG